MNEGKRECDVKRQRGGGGRRVKERETGKINRESAQTDREREETDR